MLFTLVKNEFIKLFKKAKTWIVFVLFILFIGLNVFSQYQTDKRVSETMTPEYKLNSAEVELSYINEELELLEKQEDTNPEYSEHLKQRKESAEATIEKYTGIVKNGEEYDEWELQLEESIKNAEEMIEIYSQYEDDWSKRYKIQAEEELKTYKYIQDNNLEAIYNWQFQGYAYMENLFEFFGMAILVVGIAVFMSDIVSGECTPATLKFLLIQPVTRGKVLLSKFIAVTLTVLTMILGAELLGFLFVKVVGGIDGSTYPITINKVFEKVINEEGIGVVREIAGSGQMVTNSQYLIEAILLQALFIFATCAVIFMISTIIKSSMITMATSVITTVFVTIAFNSISALENIAHFVFFNYADTMTLLTGDIVYRFNNINLNVKTGIIVMVVTSIVAYAIAHINFNKKDILI